MPENASTALLHSRRRALEHVVPEARLRNDKALAVHPGNAARCRGSLSTRATVATRRRRPSPHEPKSAGIPAACPSPSQSYWERCGMPRLAQPDSKRGGMPRRPLPDIKRCGAPRPTPPYSEYCGMPQFSQAVPMPGYQPAQRCRSAGGVYTTGSTCASGAWAATSSGTLCTACAACGVQTYTSYPNYLGRFEYAFAGVTARPLLGPTAQRRIHAAGAQRRAAGRRGARASPKRSLQ